MSKKPTNIKINLLPKDPFLSSAVGRLLQWALSAGRYIVIFTELVVIISFATRFVLDRQLTDINAEIFKKRSIILAYGELEERFRATQSKLTQLASVQQDVNIIDVFENLTKVTPREVSLTQLNISPSTISINGKALSQTSFNLLVNNLQLSNKFFNITVNKVESGQEQEAGFSFVIGAQTKEVKRQQTAAPVEKEKTDLLNRTGGL